MLLEGKSLLVVGVLIGALVLGGYVGTQLGHTAATAENAKAAREDAALILKLTNEKATLEQEIAANNHAIDLAEAKTLAAAKAQSVAEQHARDMAYMSEARMKELDKVLKDAVTVSQVLDRYWDMRK